MGSDLIIKTNLEEGVFTVGVGASPTFLSMLLLKVKFNAKSQNLPVKLRKLVFLHHICAASHSW
jgi:hypothetical protein